MQCHHCREVKPIHTLGSTRFAQGPFCAECYTTKEAEWVAGPDITPEQAIAHFYTDLEYDDEDLDDYHLQTLAQTIDEEDPDAI